MDFGEEIEEGRQGPFLEATFGKERQKASLSSLSIGKKDSRRI